MIGSLVGLQTSDGTKKKGMPISGENIFGKGVRSQHEERTSARKKRAATSRGLGNRSKGDGWVKWIAARSLGGEGERTRKTRSILSGVKADPPHG